MDMLRNIQALLVEVNDKLDHLLPDREYADL